MRSAWRRRARSALAAAALAGLVWAALCAQAVAELRYSAAERALVYLSPLAFTHDVTVELTAGGALRLADANANIVVDPSAAAHCPVVLARAVECDTGQFRTVQVLLGDQPDRFVNTSPLPMFVCGFGGNDVIWGGPGRDTLGGGPGRDDLHGGGGGDTLGVDLGDDVCVGGATADQGELLDGGPGLDMLYGGEGADVFVGGDGDDNAQGAGGDDRMIGGEGIDLLAGMDGDDELEGGDDHDILAGGGGHDRLLGGPGGDTLGTSVQLDGNGALDGQLPVVVTEMGDDVFDGGAGSDLLYAGPAARVLDFLDPFTAVAGGATDRTLESAVVNGADVMRGGDGDDIVSYVNRTLPVFVTPDGVADDGSLGELDLVDTDVERVIGGAGNDVLIARREGSGLSGGNGDDLVIGDSGDDILRGGSEDGGRDVLVGRGGDDDLAGGPGTDELDAGPGRDVLDGGDGDDAVSGGDGVDGIFGGPGSDRLEGGPGDDCLDGFVAATAPEGCPAAVGEVSDAGVDGDDVLSGGPGVDRLKGGGGEDVADASDASAPVLLVLADVDPQRAARQRSGADRDQLDADVEGARGSRWADTLLGNAGDNLLDGGPGDDLIDGGAGGDRLQGGPGRDVLVSRDGAPDQLRCGPGRDLAAADFEDDVVALRADICELVDGSVPGLPRVLAAIGCPDTVRMPGTRRAFVLEVATVVPWGTRVTPGACGTRLRTAGARRSIIASGGAFRVSRRGGNRVALALAGGRPSSCEPDSSVELRRLTVATGRAVVVRGRAAAGRGARAEWTTVDRCDGTLVSVARGGVELVRRGARPLTIRGPARRLVRLP
jgi:Ca2+-binding RTX toxin-like protein